MSSECLFCKIAAGDIPSHTLYEDDKILVMLDIYPTTEGYTLIIPKDHSDYVWDMSEELYTHAMKAARKVALKIRKAFDPKYVGLKVEGTHLAHSHIKVFQFANSDEYARLPDMSQDPDHEALSRIAERLQLD